MKEIKPMSHTNQHFDGVHVFCVTRTQTWAFSGVQVALLRDLTEALPSSHFTKKKKTCSVKISSDLFILEYSCSTSSVSIRHSNMAAIFSVHLAYGNIFAIPSIWKYRLPLLFTMPSFPIPFSTLSKYRKQIKCSAACVGSKLVIRCHPHPLWALRLYE